MVWRRVVGGAEVGGLGDVVDGAADVWARTFMALVAVVARDRGMTVMMVAVLREELDEPSSRVPLAIIELPRCPGTPTAHIAPHHTPRYTDPRHARSWTR